MPTFQQRQLKICIGLVAIVMFYLMTGKPILKSFIQNFKKRYRGGSFGFFLFWVLKKSKSGDRTLDLSNFLFLTSNSNEDLLFLIF